MERGLLLTWDCLWYCALHMLHFLPLFTMWLEFPNHYCDIWLL